MGSSKIFFFHDRVKSQPHQSNSCAIAGETEVAEQSLSPVQLVGHLFCRPYKKRDRPPKAWKLLSKWISDLATFSLTNQKAAIPAGRISALEHNAASSQVAGKKLEAQLLHEADTRQEAKLNSF